jgi:hypothetical protein
MGAKEIPAETREKKKEMAYRRSKYRLIYIAHPSMYYFPGSMRYLSGVEKENYLCMKLAL